jgi:hypothetical protein
LDELVFEGLVVFAHGARVGAGGGCQGATSPWSSFIFGLRKVTGFLFLLLCPHAIELRFVQGDLHCVVPAQIAMLIKDCANLLG